MDIRYNLLNYLNIDGLLPGLKTYREKLIKKRLKAASNKPTLDNLQTLLDYVEEISQVDREITQRLLDQQKHKDAIESGLKSVDLQPNLKIPFLLEDDKTTAYFYLTEDFELGIDL